MISFSPQPATLTCWISQPPSLMVIVVNPARAGIGEDLRYRLARHGGGDRGFSWDLQLASDVLWELFEARRPTTSTRSAAVRSYCDPPCRNLKNWIAWRVNRVAGM
jgi:hypothetical protein